MLVMPRKGTERDNILSRHRSESSNDTILPSYHMVKSIVGKKLNPGDEVYQFHHEPPAYSSSTLAIDPTISVQSINSYSESTVTILDNLDNLDALNGMVHQEIHFTEEHGEGISDPAVIDNINKEYKQGDTICGYIILQNLTTKAIPLNVYYVLFQGIYAKDDKYDRFIQMVDFKASLNYDDVDAVVDANDGTYLTLGSKLLPQIKYKRYFMFRVPQTLLDCACGNQLGKHLQTPPSCGDNMNDLMPARISYSVRSALISPKNDRYYRLADISKPLRIVPRANTPVRNDHDELRAMCKKLIEGIDQDLSSSGTRYTKSRTKMDIYIRQLQHIDSENLLHVFLKNRRIMARVPNKEYKFKYYPPALCNSPQLLSIPLELVFDQCMVQCSVVKRVSCELVAVSISSSDYTIPLEIHHKMLSSKLGNLTFDDLVIKPSLLLFKEINKIKKHDSRVNPDPQMYSELKSLSYLVSSYVRLSIDTSVENETLALQDGLYWTKNLNLHLNLNSMFLKDLDRAIKSNRLGSFCLLPSFQSCKLVRLYYLQLTVHVNNEDLVIHLPIAVE